MKQELFYGPGCPDRPREDAALTRSEWTELMNQVPLIQSIFPERSQLGCDLIRDVFASPERRTEVLPAWRTSAVKGLAGAIYEEKAFDRMPILADALEEAGCDDADVLAHCRVAPIHVRGCWVVDRVLERT